MLEKFIFFRKYSLKLKKIYIRFEHKKFMKKKQKKSINFLKMPPLTRKRVQLGLGFDTERGKREDVLERRILGAEQDQNVVRR